MEFDKLANRYVGKTATGYDAKRDRTAKWDREQEHVARLLGTLARDSRVVDIPVGTGRFVKLYAELGLAATGFDISRDMLEEARQKALEAGATVELREGDIRSISAPDRAFDAALCIRFLNWVDLEGFRVALRELARVSRADLIVTIRHYAPLRDLERSVHGVGRLARQLVRRSRQRFEKKKLVFHEKRQVTAAFEDLGLLVLESTCLERRADGTDYFIYHLRKTR
jgi:ubiquinone/menaquinone biosynthesis C-methylase UbiE